MQSDKFQGSHGVDKGDHEINELNSHMLVGASFDGYGATNEVVSPTITMTKTFDGRRFTLEVLQDLGLDKDGPNEEVLEVNSKDPFAPLNIVGGGPNEWFGEKGQQEVMGLNVSD